VIESSGGAAVAAQATMQKPAEPGDGWLLVVGSTGSKKAMARARSGFT
jgi:hypothetical protein